MFRSETFTATEYNKFLLGPDDGDTFSLRNVGSSSHTDLIRLALLSKAFY